MGLSLTEDQIAKGEYYYEYVEDTGFYHIFHNESDISPYSYASKEEAQFNVEELNMGIRLKKNMGKLGNN